MPFDITILVGTDAASSTIKAEGRVADLISKQERRTFGVDDKTLIRALAQTRGKAPDQVHLRDHAVFAKYGWEETHRVMEVVSAEIISVDLQPVALVSQKYENMRGSKPTNHTATLAYAALVSAATNWSASSKLTLEQKLTYKIGLPGNEIGGENRIGFEAAYGEGATHTRSSTITTTTAVTLSLDPGSQATATLSARKGTLRAKVTYRAYLEGDIYYDYSWPYEGHHYWADAIDDIMGSCGLTNELLSSETIEIGFYADAKVVVIDDEKPESMQMVPAQLTMD